MNIEQYEFYDDEITRCNIDSELILIRSSGVTFFNKEDAIALAKHFGLTSKDIKGN